MSSDISHYVTSMGGHLLVKFKSAYLHWNGRRFRALDKRRLSAESTRTRLNSAVGQMPHRQFNLFWFLYQACNNEKNRTRCWGSSFDEDYRRLRGQHAMWIHLVKTGFAFILKAPLYTYNHTIHRWIEEYNVSQAAMLNPAKHGLNHVRTQEPQTMQDTKPGTKQNTSSFLLILICFC